MGEARTAPVADQPPGDQLTLALEPERPLPPDGLRPMLARPSAAPFDSADHLFEPWWGGRRVLAFLEPAVVETTGGAFLTATGDPSVRLLDVDGRDLAARLPELGGLALRVDAGAAVLDGELVAVDGAGRADPGALEDRLAGRLGRAVAFLAFDLLYLDGRLLLSWPLERRRRELGRIVRPGPEIVVVPATVGEGRALHDAVVAQGLGGILARERRSPYLPGIRSRLWRLVEAGGPRDAVAAEAPAADGPAADGPANAPVLAVIERLPLLTDEE